jgi:hypothetical protein
LTSVEFFKFESIAARFRQVSFSYPDNSPDGFVLEFSIKTKENIYVEHILKTEKLLLTAKDTDSTDRSWIIYAEQHNALNEKILKLRDEIALYAQGARAQRELPFQNNSESDTSDDLFDSEAES